MPKAIEFVPSETTFIIRSRVCVSAQMDSTLLQPQSVKSRQKQHIRNKGGRTALKYNPTLPSEKQFGVYLCRESVQTDPLIFERQQT